MSQAAPPDAAALGGALAEHYGAVAPALDVLRALPSRVVAAARFDGGTAWIARAFRDEPGAAEALARHAAVLLALERHGFLAPRLVVPRGGGRFARFGGWLLLVATYVAGQRPELTPSGLRDLGGLLGRLHRLPVGELPPSSWRPGDEAPARRERLRALESRVPAGLREPYAALLAALERADRVADLPAALIHTDCYPGNAVRLPGGALALLDWDDAGVGAAVLDLGVLLTACDRDLACGPAQEPHATRIAAVMAGYGAERPPAPAELAALAGAIRYGAVVRCATAFGWLLEGDGSMDAAWRRFWARHATAEEVARVAASAWARAAGTL